MRKWELRVFSVMYLFKHSNMKEKTPKIKLVDSEKETISRVLEMQSSICMKITSAIM